MAARTTAMPYRPYAQRSRPQISPPKVATAGSDGEQKQKPQALVEITIAPRHTLQCGYVSYGPGEVVKVPKDEAKELMASGVAVNPDVTPIPTAPGLAVHTLGESVVKVGLVSSQVS